MVEVHADEHRLTLPALLARRARGASDGRLALDAGGGLIAGALVLVVRPPAWPVMVSAAACFLAFGLWGIADRAASERSAGGRGASVLRAMRTAASALGILAALALVATTMAVMLGRWIS